MSAEKIAEKGVFEMIFDQLCGIVERTELSMYKDIVERSKLFKFPRAPEDMLPKDTEHAAFVKDHFCLPSPIVAIEDDRSVVLLRDPQSDSRGLEVSRWFLECRPLSQDDIEGVTPEKIQSVSKGKQFYSVAVGCIISHGFTCSKSEATMHILHGNVDVQYLVTLDKLIANVSSPYIAYDVSRCILIDIKVALEELIYFNNHDRFIMEVKPSSRAKKSKKKRHKILRSDQRSVYT